MLEACWESNNNVLSGKGSLKSQLLPQGKTAMVISGEFLVSVSSGLTVGPLAHGRGLGGLADGGVGWGGLLKKPKRMLCQEMVFRGSGALQSSPAWGWGKRQKEQPVQRCWRRGGVQAE